MNNAYNIYIDIIYLYAINAIIYVVYISMTVIL